MVDEAIQILSEKDSSAAIEFLSAGTDVAVSARAFDEAMRQLYWEQKDLDASVAIGRAGIQFCLNAGRRGGCDSGMMRGLAKAIAYNLASFTWPGWDEPGIAVTRTHVVIGLDAARTNLRLAAELDKGSLAASRAYWIMAAHQLAAGETEAAFNGFQAGARHATAAGMPADELLNRGFGELVNLLVSPRGSGRAQLDDTLALLREMKDGKQFAEQLETAKRVFKSGQWKSLQTRQHSHNSAAQPRIAQEDLV